MTKRAPSWRTAAYTAVVLAILAIVGLVAWNVAPPVLAAAATRVSEGERVGLEGVGTSAQIEVPAGWAMARPWGSESSVLLRSPDGRMRVEVTLRAIEGTGAVEVETAMTDAAGTEIGAVSVEPDADGRALRHAHAESEDRVIAAIARGDAAIIAVSWPSPRYDAELARLLLGMELTS